MKCRLILLPAAIAVVWWAAVTPPAGADAPPLGDPVHADVLRRQAQKFKADKSGLLPDGFRREPPAPFAIPPTAHEWW